LAEHIDRIVVAPIANLSPAEAAAVFRKAFHPSGVRVRRSAAPRMARQRHRGVRHRQHRVAGRGPRAPAAVDAPPEPPAGQQTGTPPEPQVAAQLRGPLQLGESPRLAVAHATACEGVAP
jgi:hypothetical protein